MLTCMSHSTQPSGTHTNPTRSITNNVQRLRKYTRLRQLNGSSSRNDPRTSQANGRQCSNQREDSRTRRLTTTVPQRMKPTKTTNYYSNSLTQLYALSPSMYDNISTILTTNNLYNPMMPTNTISTLNYITISA